MESTAYTHETWSTLHLLMRDGLVLIYTPKWVMGTWVKHIFKALKWHLEDLNPGFLDWEPDVLTVSLPRPTRGEGGRRRCRGQRGSTHVTWYETNTGFASHAVSMFWSVECYIIDYIKYELFVILFTSSNVCPETKQAMVSPSRVRASILLGKNVRPALRLY